MFTPLPPVRSGTADYAADLITALSSEVDLEVIEKAPFRFRPSEFDQVVYQVANNPHHTSIYRRALSEPGVAVLHEVNLHHLIQSTTLHAGDSASYLRELAFELYGTDDFSGSHLAPGAEGDDFLMIRRIAGASKACIVHSGWAAKALRMKGFQGPIQVVRHGVHICGSKSESRRAELKIDPQELVVGIFGYQRPNKNEVLAIRAFEKLRRLGIPARLLIVGEPHSEVGLDEIVESLGLREDVIQLGHQPLVAFEELLSACDVVVNLRSPTYGAASGVMMRAMAAGRTVIVSDDGAFAEAPSDTCLQIPLDDHAENVLTQCLRRLALEPELCRSIGARAREWVRAHCLWKLVARQYATFLKELTVGRVDHKAPSTDSERLLFVRKWVKPTKPDQEYFAQHSARFARLLQIIPPGDADKRLLELGCYLQLTPAFHHVLGYGHVRGGYLGLRGKQDRQLALSQDGRTFDCVIDHFNAERDVFPYASHSLDCVVCSELLEHLQVDPMHMLFEIHRILKVGGALVLSTPNAVSLNIVAAALQGSHPSFYSSFPLRNADDRHSREYTPEEVRLLLSDAGLSVQRIETGPYGRDDPTPGDWVKELLVANKLSAEMRGRCTFVVATKHNGPRTRYPSWLYDT